MKIYRGDFIITSNDEIGCITECEDPIFTATFNHPEPKTVKYYKVIAEKYKANYKIWWESLSKEALTEVISIMGF